MNGASDLRKHWELGPFSKCDDANPILEANSNSVFNCPIAGEVHWESKDVFNPAAVVKDDKVYLLYRAEDTVGRYAGTSRLGLAWSEDGLQFTRHSEPVLYPANDAMKVYEWEGGCEDPRIVETEDGGYMLTYTVFDGTTARLAVASSRDLFHWDKHGLAFEGKYRDMWTKSGAIVCRQEGEKMIAAKVHGSYWMYWGESHIFAAVSDDLIHWTPVERTDEIARSISFETGKPELIRTFGEPALQPVFTPRKRRFDSWLIEPGPPALLRDEGILLLYNSRNCEETGTELYPAGTYAAGQLLFDPEDPTSILSRSRDAFFFPERPYELTGQINNVTFIEGLVYFKERWLMYYGTADSKIAVAYA